MGLRNESRHLNHLMNSMPNFDFLKQVDKNSHSLPFDEVSASNGMNHSNSTFLDLNNTTLIK